MTQMEAVAEYSTTCNFMLWAVQKSAEGLTEIVEMYYSEEEAREATLVWRSKGFNAFLFKIMDV